MTTPNLVNTSQVFMRSNIQVPVAGITDILETPAASNMIIRADVVTICNNLSVEASIDLYLTRSSSTYAIAKAIAVPAYSTMVILDKDYPVYLEEGDKLQISGNSGLQAICSYTIISDTSITLPGRPTINVPGPEIVELYAVTSATTSIVVDIDSRALVGDMIVFSHSMDSGPHTYVTVPAGVTQLDTVQSNSNYTHGLWYKILTSDDISSGSFTWVASTTAQAGIMVVMIARNVSNIAYGTSEDTTLSATSIDLSTISNNGGIWFAKAWADDQLGTISSYPSGFADNRTEIQVGAVNAGGTIAYCTSSAYPSGTQTFAFSGISGEPLHTYWVEVY